MGFCHTFIPLFRLNGFCFSQSASIYNAEIQKEYIRHTIEKYMHSVAEQTANTRDKAILLIESTHAFHALLHVVMFYVFHEKNSSSCMFL